MRRVIADNTTVRVIPGCGFVGPAARWLTIGVAIIVTLTGCKNDLEAFCEDSTTDLCKECWSCADSDREASAMCGLMAETDEEGCRLILRKVCTSDDNTYNGESARACVERIDKLSCDQLEREGKPEVCSRLF